MAFLLGSGGTGHAIRSFRLPWNIESLDDTVRVEKTDVIGGLPAAVARDVVRRYAGQSHAWRGKEILDRAGVHDFLGALRRLADEGYLESGSASTEANPMYETTILGSALGMASFGKPITRKTADALVEGLIARARALNADPEQLHSVERIRLFGSYLDTGVDRLGDVDVEVNLARRVSHEALMTYGREADKSFGSYIDMIFWSQTEFKQKLRNRSTALNITTEDVGRFTDNVRTVYDITEDSEACPVPEQNDDSPGVT